MPSLAWEGVLQVCSQAVSADSHSEPPRLVGLQVGNWYPEPVTVNVHIEAAGDSVYENRIQLPAGNPSSSDRPSKNLDDHPSDVAPSAVLSTWLEAGSSDGATRVELGDHPYDECIGIQIDVCPDCERQKGTEQVSAPDTPEILVLSTSSCSYPGSGDESLSHTPAAVMSSTLSGFGNGQLRD